MRRILGVLVLSCAACLCTSCVTSALIEDTTDYASPSNEFRQQRMFEGGYVGTEVIDDFVHHIYQFETPFADASERQKLQVAIPNSVPSVKHPVHITEVRRGTTYVEPAELWIWRRGRGPTTLTEPVRRLDFSTRHGHMSLTYPSTDVESEYSSTLHLRVDVPWRERQVGKFALRIASVPFAVVADIVLITLFLVLTSA